MTEAEARAPRADAARNREQLLAVATRVFVSAGTEPSMRAIAREAGVGIATLYRHFPTRESLVDAVYQDQVVRLTAGARDLLGRLPPAAAMRRWMDLFGDWIATKNGMLDTLLTMIESGEIAHAQTRTELLAAITTILDAGSAAGDLRSDVTAEDIAASLIGIFTVAPRPEHEAKASRLLNLLMDGLRPAGRRKPGTTNATSEIRQHARGRSGENPLVIAEAQGIRIRHRGYEPQVHPTAYVAPTATLVGDVRVGPRARVMYGAVLDAEGSRIEVGEATVICENAVLRGSAVAGDQPVLVDDHVFVGPHATLLGCEVGRCVYVATAATVLQCARLGAGSVVAVGALVHARTVLPDEYFVPPHTVALDAPVRLLAPGDPGLAEAVRRVGFAQVAFGVDAEWTDRIRRYEHIAEVRVAEFGTHADDEVLNRG